MKTWTKGLLGLTIVLVLGSLFPQDIAAQQVCGLCFDEWDSSAGRYKHKFGSSGAMAGCDVNPCHYEYWAWDYCFATHGPCLYAATDMAKKIRFAVNNADLKLLRRILAQSNEPRRPRAVLNRGTRSIDVFACDGRLVGRIAAQPTVLASLADRKS